mmetsp:Transcript_42129/g.134703  ORF Transcript_42129/g.134703 Transcript_42129/m.134703 type:complete len:238 (-) Transcript_42129:437-1150(-)
MTQRTWMSRGLVRWLRSLSFTATCIARMRVLSSISSASPTCRTVHPKLCPGASPASDLGVSIPPEEAVTSLLRMVGGGRSGTPPSPAPALAALTMVPILRRNWLSSSKCLLRSVDSTSSMTRRRNLPRSSSSRSAMKLQPSSCISSKALDRWKFSSTLRSLYVMASRVLVRMRKSLLRPGWRKSCTAAAMIMARMSRSSTCCRSPECSIITCVACTTSMACARLWYGLLWSLLLGSG